MKTLILKSTNKRLSSFHRTLIDGMKVFNKVKSLNLKKMTNLFTWNQVHQDST